jgi:hypothetical protein
MQRQTHHGNSRSGHSAANGLLVKAQNHLARKELPLAQAIYQRILRTDAGNLVARRNMGATLVEQDKLEQALVHYELALKYHPNDAELHYSLGVIEQRFNKLYEAMGHYLRAIELRPKHIEAFENLANIQTQLCLYDDALTSYQHILDIEPGRDSTLYSMSLILLLHGHFKEGWTLYEHRWATPDFGNKHPSEVKRIWNHPSELSGKSVLLVHEQGFGDTIQFCRYALVLANANAQVTLVVQKELKTLLQSLNNFSLPFKIIIIEKKELDDQSTYDYCLPLLSAPFALRDQIKGIPEVGKYLCSDEKSNIKWSQRIKDNSKLKIGVSWYGNPAHNNDKNRSIDFDTFKMLFSENAEFHLLNNYIDSENLKKADRIPNLKIWNTEIENFADTCALISCMDLVISVDTSIAHLAGSANVPCKLLIPAAPDFRWLLNTKQTPWYKSIKIYRSHKPLDWTDVILELKIDLKKIINP